MPVNQIPLGTTFTITIFHDRYRYCYTVKKTYETVQIEHFTLYNNFSFFTKKFGEN